MRAVWISKHGGPDVLEVRETPDPEPKAGEVRVRVRASGLNFADVMARMGLYPDAPPPPCVVGYEVTGVIDAVGAGAGLAAGTRVLCLTRFGGHADTVCVSEPQALVLPDEMSFEEGTAVPVNYLTAYHMLFRAGSVHPGERVLVHMAAGGVGLALLQLLATVEGVTVFGTASASKHEMLRKGGCHHPIDYRSQDYAAEVLKLTDGKGVDLVLDALGGGDFRKGYRLLRPSGRLVAFGFANMASGERRSLLHALGQLLRTPRFSPIALMNDNRGVIGVNMGHMWSEVAMLRPEMEALLRLYREGRIRPHIDSTFRFTEAAQAHRRMQERKNVGKIVLIP